MKNFAKVFLFASFGLILVSAIVMASGHSTKASEFGVIMGFVSGFQFVLQTLVAVGLFIAKKKEWAFPVLLSGVILFAIGFSICTANFSLNMH